MIHVPQYLCAPVPNFPMPAQQEEATTLTQVLKFPIQYKGESGCLTMQFGSQNENWTQVYHILNSHPVLLTKGCASASSFSRHVLKEGSSCHILFRALATTHAQSMKPIRWHKQKNGYFLQLGFGHNPDTEMFSTIKTKPVLAVYRNKIVGMWKTLRLEIWVFREVRCLQN